MFKWETYCDFNTSKLMISLKLQPEKFITKQLNFNLWLVIDYVIFERNLFISDTNWQLNRAKLSPSKLVTQVTDAHLVRVKA